jgi:hypothetical protein
MPSATFVQIQAKVPKTTQKLRTFFNDVRALLRYLLFESWEHLLDFMLEQLEVVVPS